MFGYLFPHRHIYWIKENNICRYKYMDQIMNPSILTRALMALDLPNRTNSIIDLYNLTTIFGKLCSFFFCFVCSN